MSSSKMNTINDPLAAQKTQAANIGLGNYQQASSNVPSLQGYYSGNFGQSPQTTLANEGPMANALYGEVQQDLTGSGGPYANLQQNLLGSFDTQQTNTQNQLQQQLQAQGLLGSGAGMAVLGNQGTGAAQARSGIVDQNQVNMLNMANTLNQNLQAQNQQQGFTNPMAALGEIQSLATPPNFQDINNTYYTPQQSPLTQMGLTLAGQAASKLLSAGMGSMGGSPSSSMGGSPSSGALQAFGGGTSPYYGPSQSQLGGPMTLSSLGGY